MKVNSLVLTVGSVVILSTFNTSAAPEPNPERNAYFGETHRHTSWSSGAFIFRDKTLLASSDELGFANCEIIPVRQELVNPAFVKR